MNEVEDFIRRRFPIDCHWLDGNCYFFAIILMTRFPQAMLWYNQIEGHFLVSIEGTFYDWTGAVEPNWNEITAWDWVDERRKERIVRDCIM